MPEVTFETTTPAEAFDRWKAHRDRFAATGLWPVIVPEEEVGRMREAIAEQAPSISAELAEGRNLDIHAYFQELLAQRREWMKEDEEWDADDAPDFDFDSAKLERSERPAAAEQIYALHQGGGVVLALVPCAQPWESPLSWATAVGTVVPCQPFTWPPFAIGPRGMVRSHSSLGTTRSSSWCVPSKTRRRRSEWRSSSKPTARTSWTRAPSR